jgi:hypothetical protein
VGYGIISRNPFEPIVINYFIIAGSISNGLGRSNDGGIFLTLNVQCDILSIFAREVKLHYFLWIFVYEKSKDIAKNKQLKQKELKRQKQNKEKYFANLKGQ